MADILLATSYFLCLDPKQQRIMKPYPPLATLYAAAVLRSEGHSVALFDAMFEPGPEAFARALKGHRPQVVVLYEDSFNWLTKMCLSRIREAAFQMMDLARARGILVIAAGPDASDEPETYLEFADCVILHEGERTLTEVLEWHHRGDPREALRAIPGLALPPALAAGRQSSAIHTPPRALIQDLDSLPLPAWDLVDVARYRTAWLKRHGYFSLNQITTRGCPFRCNWCAKPVYGDVHTSRSPENLVAELRWVKEHLRPDHIWYSDDILGLRKKWLIRFSALASKADVAIPFSCQTRVDLMTEANVAALKHAGCREVWMGAESGAQSILDAMDKGTTVAQIHLAAQRLHRQNIRVGFFLQLGYPGEGWKEIQQTRALIRTARPDELGISVSYPLPGTRFYDQVQGQIEGKDRWEHSDDLDPLFPGTYPKQFYQHLHRLIHAEHQLRIGVQTMGQALRQSGGLSRRDRDRFSRLPLHLGRFLVRRTQVAWGRRIHGRTA